MVKILIADDDAHIRELIPLFLSNEGYEIEEASDGAEALSIVENNRIDLVVLDIMMPKVDGWELCKEIRQLDSNIPLLMVSVKGETGQKVKGFQLGTDDYLTKPFDPIELVMRVKALLKRYQIISSQTLMLGGIELNRRNYQVIRGKL
ncbi:hypothetical protein L3i20_v238110 [Paenibacillus sp. L3-i20]|nr:hypothetical protein L3i20_v238110 [Paenibacillus sp. L3-i20]